MVVDIINTVILSWWRSLTSLSCITFQLDQQSFHQVIILRVSAHYQPINISIFIYNKKCPISISTMMPCLPRYKNKESLMLVCIDREATWFGFLKAPSPGTVPVKNTDCDAHSNSSNFGWYTAPAVASWGSFMFGNCCAYTVLQCIGTED